uniref:Thiamin biosynthesis protein S n=1 Tax=Caloglossa intermedia TaxID=100879 RepID=A0A1Z1M6B4_9FLOR|nr:thiamin biosynthesis protein S [Caloglossa intermedia]ARW61546.1 thiamin biosynthesis protein S [Caloglossa intermedia]
MEDYITIYVNGEPFNCESHTPLKDFLLYLEFDLSKTIIEYNGRIVTLPLYSSIFLRMNDSVEVVTIVGGG